MEKYYASKENCDTAKSNLELARIKLNNVHTGSDISLSLAIMAVKDYLDRVEEFLEAAHKRLPMHSSCVRSEQQRKKRAKEQVNANG